MNKQTEALKLALEALENTTPTGFNMERDKQFFAAITALREALAEQPAQQEPVACPYCHNSHTLGAVYFDQNCVGCVKRMTTPPQRKPPQFPTMLRKMWSGAEVQNWINENWSKT